jgi:hypothetical protein
MNLHANDTRPSPTVATPELRAGWVHDPIVRNYLFIGLSALLVVAAALFMRGGLIAALMPATIAALGLVARLTVIPIIFLVLVCYFAVFPFGVPYLGSPHSDIPGSHFRITDLILVAAVLTYFAAQFRLLSMTLQGMPPDTPPDLRKKGDKSPRRPGSIAPPEEVSRLFVMIGACVVIGQVVWFLVSEMRPNLSEFPPLRLAVNSPMSRYNPNEPADRFLLLGGLAAVITLPTGLAFWYWRLIRLNPAEARLTLLDTGWRETRRELNRQEKWRAWGSFRRNPRPVKKTRPEKPPRPTGKRRSLAEAVALTCGMLLLGGIAAFVAAVFLVRWFGGP